MIHFLKASVVVVGSILISLLGIEGLLYISEYGFHARPASSSIARFSRKPPFSFDPAARLGGSEDTSSFLVPTTFGEREIVNPNPGPRPVGGRKLMEQVDWSKRIESTFWNKDKPFHLAPGYAGRSIVRLKTGQLVYDVDVKVDDFGRRDTNNPDPQLRTKHLVMFGCSFVFGEGLEQAHTLPSQVAALAPDYFVYNYGVQGAGPQDIAARVEEIQVPQEVPQMTGIGLYLFISDHIRRTVPSISYLGFHKAAPYYAEDEKGEIRRYVNYQAAHPMKALAYNVLEKSEILNHFAVDIPMFFGEEHYRTTAHVISYFAHAYKKRFPQDEFYVVIFPDHPLFDGVMAHYLTQYGVKVLDYSHFNVRNYVKGLGTLSAIDPHPDAEADAVLADQIVRDLRLTSTVSR